MKISERDLVNTFVAVRKLGVSRSSHGKILAMVSDEVLKSFHEKLCRLNIGMKRTNEQISSDIPIAFMKIILKDKGISFDDSVREQTIKDMFKYIVDIEDDKTSSKKPQVEYDKTSQAKPRVEDGKTSQTKPRVGDDKRSKMIVKLLEKHSEDMDEYFKSKAEE